MRVRFWGTRGSIPVGLTVADMRDRLAQALVAAEVELDAGRMPAVGMAESGGELRDERLRVTVRIEAPPRAR